MYRGGDARRMMRGIALHLGMSYDEAVAFIYGRVDRTAEMDVARRLERAKVYDLPPAQSEARRGELKGTWYADANCGLLIAGRP
jgi:hypothetical protein